MPKRSLKNSYYALRHGQSEANVAGIIISNPTVGCHQYGLTETGRQQVFESIKNVSGFTHEVHIFSSDFLRAKQTAEISFKLLQSSYPIQYSTALRERCFGELNGQKDNRYQDVWNIDRSNADHREFNVESANQVVARSSALIQQLEKHNSDKLFLLVAHGDVLQLLQTWFYGVPASQHRALPHLNTAEIRCLNQV